MVGPDHDSCRESDAVLQYSFTTRPPIPRLPSSGSKSVQGAVLIAVQWLRLRRARLQRLRPRYGISGYGGAYLERSMQATLTSLNRPVLRAKYALQQVR